MIRHGATRAHQWWDQIDGDERAVPLEAPDPWADHSTEHIDLSDDQRQFLVGEDQPALPRLRTALAGADVDGRPPGDSRGAPTGQSTGNPPGDAEPTTSYRPST